MLLFCPALYTDNVFVWDLTAELLLCLGFISSDVEFFKQSCCLRVVFFEIQFFATLHSSQIDFCLLYLWHEKVVRHRCQPYNFLPLELFSVSRKIIFPSNFSCCSNLQAGLYKNIFDSCLLKSCL